ncbi:MAG: hypothetical protein U9N46_00880 [Euryarchaeota archaeon]|nr:hypothetical protein [Euryarchaeota archaeon]
MNPGSVTESNSAIATVISAVLVLGLIVTATTMLHVYYIPAWKSDSECAHLTDVQVEMSDLKSRIDILSALLAVDPESTAYMSMPIELGGGDIPIIGTIKSSGMLAVNVNDCGIVVVSSNKTHHTVYNSGTDLTHLGAIHYHSRNNYYIDQMFECENGALIIVQDNRSLMKLSPAITITKNAATDNISVAVNAIKLIGEKRTISSTVVEEVMLTSNTSSELFSSGNDLFNVSTVDITMYTNYPDAWETYFNTTAENADLGYGSSNDYTITSDVTSVTLSVSGRAGEDDISLHVNRITIDASVGNL